MSTRPSDLDLLLAHLAGDVAGGEPATVDAVEVAAVVASVIKGKPVRVFEGQAINGLSDVAVDCRGFNAVHIAVTPAGTTPTATLTIEGGEEEGVTTGNTLPDPAATQSLTGTAARFDVVVGAAWIRVRLASISGTGAAYTVVVTPFVAAGPATVKLAAGTAAIGTVDTELPAAAALADGAANPTAPTVGADVAVWNGATWDRQKGASAAALAAALGTGVALVAPPGNWTAVHAPAAATQATISKAAGGAGVRHIATGITATIACGATAQTPINVYLRDGATGAGAIIWAGAIAAPANGVGVITLTGLSIVGTANTAMTLEFSAAGVAASVEAVTLTGYDVS